MSRQNSYTVIWEITIGKDELMDPSSHREAAFRAFQFMQRPGTTANVFDVIDDADPGNRKTVDLEEFFEE